MGFRAASTLADALEMVVRDGRPVALDQLPARAAADRGEPDVSDGEVRKIAAWATSRGRRGSRQVLRGTASDVRDVATGWRWGRRPLVPRSAESSTPPRESPVFPTGWARTRPVRILREVVQVVGLKTLMRKDLAMDVHGLDELRTFSGPALIVANHSSHLDTAVLLTTLPAQRRRTTAVAAAADYFFDTWWRAGGSAIAFNTFPIERRGGALLGTPAELLAAGWSVVVYPEGTRSRDGFMGRFRMGAAWMAVEYQVPVIPVGHQGHVRGHAARRELAGPRPTPGQRPVRRADHPGTRRDAPRAGAARSAQPYAA